MEIFPRFAVGFQWKAEDASRARIFSWSGQGDGTIHAKLGGQVQERVWKVH